MDLHPDQPPLDLMSPVEVRCEHCGSPVTVPAVTADDPAPVYCRPRCRQLDEAFRAVEAVHDQRFELDR